MTEPAPGRAGAAGSRGPGRSAAWRPILLLVIAAPLVVGLLFVLRSGGALMPAPAVDWSAYPPEVHEAVDRAAKNLDCAGLAEQRTWATSASASGVDTAPLVAYIDGIR